MGRRLEKYYLFCNTAFFSLFTMKFVRYVYILQHTLQVGTKKACKLYHKLLKFRYIVNLNDYIFIQHTLQVGKSLQNIS